MNITALPNDIFMTLDAMSSNFHAPSQIQRQQPLQFSSATARMTFPEKLHTLLSDAEKCGFTDIVAWQGNGESFKIHKPTEFTQIIPTYFNKPIKFTSFQRQLSIYGFQRIRTGWNTGGYSHAFFVRNSPDLCKMVKRHCKPPTSGSVISELNRSVGNNVHHLDPLNLTDDFFDAHHHATSQKVMDERMDNAFDLEPIPLSSPVSKHTLPDKIGSLGGLFSMENDQHIIEKLNNAFLQEDIFSTGSKLNANWNAPQEAPETNDGTKSAFFPSKLHHLLQDAGKLNFEHIVSWTDEGRAFQIHDQKTFVEKIMNIYFDQSKFASFRRQLNLYGFRRRRSGNNTGNEYFHENFIKASPTLCHKMLRKSANNKNGAGA